MMSSSSRRIHSDSPKGPPNSLRLDSGPLRPRRSRARPQADPCPWGSPAACGNSCDAGSRVLRQRGVRRAACVGGARGPRHGGTSRLQVDSRRRAQRDAGGRGPSGVAPCAAEGEALEIRRGRYAPRRAAAAPRSSRSRGMEREGILSMDDTASSPSGELVKASLTRVETLETIEVLWNPARYRLQHGWMRPSSR